MKTLKSILNVLGGLFSFFQGMFIGLTALCLLSIPTINWFWGTSGDYGGLADTLVFLIFASALVANVLQTIVQYVQTRNGWPIMAKRESKILWILIGILFVAGSWYPGARHSYRTSLVTEGGFVNGICDTGSPMVNGVFVAPSKKGAFMNWVCMGEYSF